MFILQYVHTTDILLLYHIRRTRRKEKRFVIFLLSSLSFVMYNRERIERERGLSNGGHYK